MPNAKPPLYFMLPVCKFASQNGGLETNTCDMPTCWYNRSTGNKARAMTSRRKMSTQLDTVIEDPVCNVWTRCSIVCVDDDVGPCIRPVRTATSIECHFQDTNRFRPLAQTLYNNFSLEQQCSFTADFNHVIIVLFEELGLLCELAQRTALHRFFYFLLFAALCENLLKLIVPTSRVFALLLRGMSISYSWSGPEIEAIDDEFCSRVDNGKRMGLGYRADKWALIDSWFAATIWSANAAMDYWCRFVLLKRILI